MAIERPIHAATVAVSCAITLAFVAMFSPVAAQDTRSMDVLGSVSAAVEGEERTWLTIAGDVSGEHMVSATWEPYALPDFMTGGMFEGMGEEQRQRMEQQMEAMGDLMGDGGPNPMAQMFGGGGEDQIVLRIAAVDPESERILREGMLMIEVLPFSTEDMDRVIAAPHDADISLFKNFGEQTGLFISSHDFGTDAVVEFDRVEIVEGGGFAEGQFAASLCPMRSVIQRDFDADECPLIEGRFATELGEDEGLDMTQVR